VKPDIVIMPIGKDVDLNQLAILTKYYSGADIESLCREAAMEPVRDLDLSGKISDPSTKVRPV
jgi:transitional endoplasmic reticulum ATPase